MGEPTPGPWTVIDNHDLNDAYWILARHPDGFTVSIAEVRSGGSEAREIGDPLADAALIAEAPALLDAVKRLIVIAEGAGRWHVERFERDKAEAITATRALVARIEEGAIEREMGGDL